MGFSSNYKKERDFGCNETSAELDMNLVDAQQARRILDRMVGYQLSPLLWKKIRRGLSAGRVQSVAVRMIVEREREIEAFVPVEYWEVFVEVQDGGRFVVKLVEIDGNKADLSKKDLVDPVVADLGKAQYSVGQVDKTEVRKRPFRRLPPVLYNRQHPELSAGAVRKP